jgi:hypothetical protein
MSDHIRISEAKFWHGYKGNHGLITRPEESYRVSKYICDHRNPERGPMFQLGTTGKWMNKENPQAIYEVENSNSAEIWIWILTYSKKGSERPEKISFLLMFLIHRTHHCVKKHLLQP